ncbi:MULTISPECIES: type III pantothenate kinase [Nocardiopsis]|uniref:Type III pantothenate kinase n=2 Tax=Nocardiopsis TaxID=2013 RepID=D7B857_NOCDD|nr:MULTISPECIES: type III pantothenate kinase [Nocardiopsis]ADH70365.1 putative transcriptional acitvator, Baf family [Nocardiopsis dassonvillei subsp. dassonvillei DSM 43111]APC33653.1 pantothenate kinase [Nocardiopsis dassonvillei]ASU56506.1 type III pantothenate kinase [Nocardiopsis dassonvillei]MCK9872471.1 type III pantothenate kinase [Nocardiopsis dassonvillei]NKY76997.1 type III pantothenate kinase [Nocardiopsis dassonvillei]
MLLAIDVGNSETVFGLFASDDLLEHWRVGTDTRRTADEWAVVLRGLVDGSSLGRPEDIDGIALCCSVPSVQHEMRDMFRRHFGDVPAVIVEPGVKTGVPIRMDNPKEVGSDRIINALAANHLYGGPAVVVDFGTATTFDAVSARGEYVGGAIAPGIDISVDALSRRGAQLHMVEIVKPRAAIAKNTTEALRSGIVFGFAGQVDGIVDRMVAELTDAPDDVTVVATGGLASIVVAECETVDLHEPWLTLIGLRLVYERNVG